MATRLQQPELENVPTNVVPESRDLNCLFDLVQYTLCVNGYDYREDVRREPEHYIMLAALHHNVEYVHALMAVHEMRWALADQQLRETDPETAANSERVDPAIEALLENKAFKYQEVVLGIFSTHELPRTCLTYRQLAKTIRSLFKYKIDAVRLKRICDLCVEWGWLEKSGNEYVLPLELLNYSAQHRCLQFDSELYENKYADQIDAAEQYEEFA